MQRMPIITMDAATPYERGVQYGEQAKEQIDIALSYYKRKFSKKFRWKEIVDFAERFDDVTQKFSADAMNEIRGIADGSGHDVREIMTINARYELSQFDWQHECTTGVFIDNKEHNKFIFKNCDLAKEVKNHLVILHIIRPDGLRALGVAEAGQLVRDGFNNFGIALVNSALRSGMDYSGIAVPGTVIRKKIWESKSFAEACNIQRNCFRTVSTNMLIASTEGIAVDFECYPGGEDEVLPKNKIIATGNRFTIKPSRNRAIDPAIDRGIQLRNLLENQDNNINLEVLMNILKNHEGYPESICRHADEIGHTTVYSIIINLTDCKVYICFGNPCSNAYEEYVL